MEKMEIRGHTIGAIYKKEYFTEDSFAKQLEKRCRKTRKIIRKKIEPKLRQIKIEYTRTYILVDIFKEKDFALKKPVSKFEISFRDIDRVEIKIVGNTNKDNYYKDYKIRFYNELGDEILYVNFASNDEFYAYRNSLKGYQLLVAHLNINNIEYNISDETYFR